MSWLRCEPSARDDTDGAPGARVKFAVAEGLSTAPGIVCTARTESLPGAAPSAGMLQCPSGPTSAVPSISPVSRTFSPGVPVPSMPVIFFSASPSAGLVITGAASSETVKSRDAAPERLNPLTVSAASVSGPVVSGAG